jgi:hypothetical protein
MRQKKFQGKLELILGNLGNNPELLFNDLKQLHTLAQCSNAEPVTIGHIYEHINKTYGLSIESIDLNLVEYESWLDVNKNKQIEKNKLKQLQTQDLTCYL